MASRERRYLRRPPFGDREPAVEEQNGFAAAKTLVEDADIAGGNPPGALAAREDGPDGERHEGMNPGLAGLERPDGIHLEPGSNSHDLRILHSRMMSSGCCSSRGSADRAERDAGATSGWKVSCL